MKRRASRWSTQCTLQQFSTDGGARFAYSHGIFLLLLVLLPQSALAVWRARPFESKVDTSGAAVRCIGGLSPAEHVPVCAGESRRANSIPPLARAALPAALCRTNSFFCMLLTKDATSAGRGGSCLLGENQEKRKISLCELGDNKAGCRSPPSLPLGANAGTPLPPPRLGSLRCPSCSSESSSHASRECTVFLNKSTSRFLLLVRVSPSVTQVFSTALKTARLTLALNRQTQYTAVRRLLRQSPLATASFVQSYSCGWFSFCLRAGKWSYFSPVVNSHEHGVLTHVPDNFSHRPIHNRLLQYCPPLASFCETGKTASACLLGRRCSAWWAHFCIHSDGWRYGEIAAQRAGYYFLQCPPRHSRLLMRSQQAHTANGFRCFSIRIPYNGRRPRIQGVAKTKCLTATKRYAKEFQTDWKDAAALRDAEHREQETFEKMASQVESHLRSGMDVCTAVVRNPFDGQSLVQHDCHRAALQQPDQHGHQANPARPAADYCQGGSKTREAEQHQGCRDGERLADQHAAEETADEHRKRRHASTVRKGYHHADGILRPTEVSASRRTGTDRQYGKEATNETATSMASLTVPERLHESELSHSEKGCSTRVSWPSRSSGVERQSGVTGRHTLVDRKLVGVQLKGTQREQIGGTQPQQCPVEKLVRNKQEQRGQVMVGVPTGRQDCSPHRIAAAQRDRKFRTPAHAGQLSQRGSDKFDDSVNRGGTGDGEEGRRGDRRLIHLLLQSGSVSDVWRILHSRNVQLLSGAGLVGVVQRLAFLCVAAQRQTERPFGRADATLEPNSGRVEGLDASLCGNQRNTSPCDISPGLYNSVKLKLRAELKKHPIFKDIMNALPSKVDSLRTSEATALLHALATLRIRSAPNLLQRTGAVIAAKGFGTGSVEHASVKPTPVLEHLKDVTLGRLWTSLEMLPTLQRHPLRDALTCYTIRRLKNAPERGARDKESAVAMKESRPEVVDLQEDCTDSKEQVPSNDIRYHKREPISAVTAAVIAKAAMQMHVGSQAPDFVRALQLYVLRLLLDNGSEAPDGTVGIGRRLETKHMQVGARSSVMVRLILSLAILKSQQEEMPDSHGSVAPETSRVSLGVATRGLDEQTTLAAGRRPTRLSTTVNESPRRGKTLYLAGTTAWSDTTETAVEEDGVFLKALGAYFRSRMATAEPALDELSRLLKALNYFYRSALWKLQLKMHTKDRPSRGCGILRSSVALLPSLLVAAAVVIKQKEGSVDNLVGLADLLINLNSSLQTSKDLLKITEGYRTAQGYPAASLDRMNEIGKHLARAEEATCLAQKLQENEWRRGEEFVQSVLRRMAERLHHHLGSLLQELRKKKEAQEDLESRKRTLSGTLCFEDTSLAPTHLILLDKSQELLAALLQLNCTFTGDRLVECVRMLIDVCDTSPSRSEKCLVFKEVEDDGGTPGEKAPRPGAAYDNRESISKSQSTVRGKGVSSPSASFLQRATQTIHSTEEERVRWRRQLLDGSLLLRFKVRRTNCSIRRAIWAANTVDEVLSAVMSGVEHRQLSASRLQTPGAAARAAESRREASSSGDFQNVLKASSADARGGLLENSLDDLTMTSALHRLALLQQRHHEDYGMSGTQSSVPQMEAGKRDGNFILHDPRLHLLLQAVAAKIPTMGQQVTRILWALGKLRYFEQQDTLDSEIEFQRPRLLQQSSLHGCSRPGLAGPEDAGIENAAATPPAFSALRKNIMLLLVERLAELIRAGYLSDSELSATLHVLSGKSFSTTVSAAGLPNFNASPWVQAVDSAFQNIRRGVSSTLLRSAHSLSGVDASVALYSLAALGWTATAPRRLPSLTREPFKTNLEPSESRGAQKETAPKQARLRGLEQDEAYASTRVSSNSPTPREFWEDVQALPNKNRTGCPGNAGKNDALYDKESLTYSALLQRLTEEMDNCNVQTLVVALWAVAITAGQRQPVSQRQTTTTDEREEEHETVAETTDVETCTLSRCIQNGTSGPHEHGVEEPLIYEKPVWLSPVETTFLAAVRDKLKKQVAEMGRAPLSMLLLSALMLRWQEPTLLLKTIRRTLDVLRMGSVATTAEKAACSVDGKRLESEGTDVFLFRESRGSQKTGELHSRVWAILAMLEQQHLFPVTREIGTSEKGVRFKHKQHRDKQPEQAPSHWIELRSVKRLAAVQLKEDLDKAVCTSVRSFRPQREWTIQHVQSLLLSCTIMEEDRMQHQQQLEFNQNLAVVADPPASWLPGADDTRQVMRQVFFLLERLTSSLLSVAAPRSDAAIELHPQPEKGAIQQKQSAAESEAQTLLVTERPAARGRSEEADTGCEAVRPELMHQQLKLTQWVKRLSLLLFALRRLRQLLFDNSVQESRLRETNPTPNPEEEIQLTERATLVPPKRSKQQPEKDFSPTKGRYVPVQSSVTCPPYRVKLLEGVAQLITALLRSEALHPSHPQLPSLLTEFHRLLEASELSSAGEENGQSRILSFPAGPSRPSAENDLIREEHIPSAGHKRQERTHESVALNDVKRKLGEALSDWVCLHLGETDDRMYNVLLPLVQTLGAEAHLLSALHRIALQPVKEKMRTDVPDSDVGSAPYVTDMPSEIRDFGINSQECSSRLPASDRWVTTVLPCKADFTHSQQLQLRRSRAASLALVLHHRHRMVFHPPSLHMSLVQSATEPAELLATFPSDAAHALTALQRWKTALGRAETHEYPEMLDLQLSNTGLGGLPSVGPRGQESCSTHLGPSGFVSALKTSAPHDLLRSRVQVLVSGLSQPLSRRKGALHARNSGVSTTDMGGTRQPVKDASGFGQDKPSRAHEQVFSPPPELPSAKSCENQSPEHCTDSGLTRWDMLPLQQLVHASTAAAQLLELPSADPVWKRAYLTSNTTDSGTRGATLSRIPYMFANTGCKAMKFCSESCSDFPYNDAGKRPSLYSNGLAPAAAALTRYLLQQHARYSGPLPVPSTLPEGTDSTYASSFGQFVEQQTVMTGGLSYLKANAGNRLPSCDISCCVCTHASSAKPYRAESARSSTQTNTHRQNAGGCDGIHSMRCSFGVAASSRSSRRLRLFVKARRDWLAAAGALRLLGGGDNLEDVTQTLAAIACEIGDLLEGYTYHVQERVALEQNAEEQDRTHSVVYSEEELELVDVEKQPSPDDVFFEEEENMCATTGQPAVGCVASSAKTLHQRNSGTTLEKQQLVLVQQLACSCFEEMSHQLKALHTRSAIYSRTGDSRGKAHCEKAAQAVSVSGVRLLGALASAPVLPVNAAAFLLQPSLAALGTAGDEQVAWNRQAVLFHSPQKGARPKASSIAEAYTVHLTMLIRRLLPLAPQWAPRLGSHRAAALFMEAAENVECARLCELQQLADGKLLPASGLFCSKSTAADAAVCLSDKMKRGRRQDQNSSLLKKEKLREDDRDKWLARSFMRTKRSSGYLQGMLLGLQKTILSHAQGSPGRMARFWRALTLQAESEVLQSKKFAVAYSEEVRSQAANSTINRRAHDEEVSRCRQRLERRTVACRAVFTTVTRFLDELTASAALVSHADSPKHLHGNAAGHPGASHCPTLRITAATSRTTGGHKVSIHSNEAGVLFSCTASSQGTDSVDWIYGAVAAAGSGLLGDSAQQRIATTAAQVSDGTANYFGLLSFLANSRDAPVDAIASLVQMLASAARDHLSVIGAADVVHPSPRSAQVKHRIRKQKNEQQTLKPEGTVTETDHPVEGSESERVTAFSVYGGQSNSTRLVRLARAAWLMWIATSLQQPKQRERSSGLHRGHVCWEIPGVPKSVDEKDTHPTRAAMEAAEEVINAIVGLLQEEASRQTSELKYPRHTKRPSTDRCFAAATLTEVYRLLILSLDTVVKMYPENSEHGGSRRLSRIEAILSALTSLIEAAIHRTSQTPSTYGFSQGVALSFLSHPSLPSMAYILHLVRQARVYYPPLLHAISGSIHWHRQGAFSREEKPATWDDTSENSGLHEVPSRLVGGCCSVTTRGGCNVDLWPSLLLLADAATHQPQEALRSLKQELLLFVERLVEGAPLSHIVRILRFSMNATPIREVLPSRQPDRGSFSNRVTPGEATAEVWGASQSFSRLQAAQEPKVKRVYDNMVHRCMTEGASLLLKLQPNGKDWSGTLEEQLAKLEADGYAPVGLVDTLNKIHLLQRLSKAKTGGTTAAEEGKQGIGYEVLPGHLRSDASDASLAREAHKSTTAKGSRRNADLFSVPSKNSGWWPQILRWIVKYYIGKRSSGLHKDEVWTATGLSLDIVLDQRAVDGKPIAVEVDGPTHYVTALMSSPAAARGYHDSSGDPGKGQFFPPCRRQLPTALTQFKRQLLEQTGWHVVSIPYFEWKLPSRTHPLTPESERRKTANLKTQSMDQPETATLGQRNDTTPVFAAEEQHSVLLVAAKLRPLLSNPPFNMTISETTENS